MLDELKQEELINKVGGRFKLSILIQKRLLQLKQGSRALVELDTVDKMSVALQEILQDKIYLDTSHEVRVTGDVPLSGDVPDLNPTDL
jgi:DNA-directed RNA polymerase subunit omega